MSTMKVKLTSPRVGHKFDSNNRFTGVFSEAAGAIVEMKKDEAERYLERGLAELPPTDKK